MTTGLPLLLYLFLLALDAWIGAAHATPHDETQGTILVLTALLTFPLAGSILLGLLGIARPALFFPTTARVLLFALPFLGWTHWRSGSLFFGLPEGLALLPGAPILSSLTGSSLSPLNLGTVSLFFLFLLLFRPAQGGFRVFLLPLVGLASLVVLGGGGCALSLAATALALLAGRRGPAFPGGPVYFTFLIFLLGFHARTLGPARHAALARTFPPILFQGQPVTAGRCVIVASETLHRVPSLPWLVPWENLPETIRQAPPALLCLRLREGGFTTLFCARGAEKTLARDFFTSGNLILEKKGEDGCLYRL